MIETLLRLGANPGSLLQIAVSEDQYVIDTMTLINEKQKGLVGRRLRRHALARITAISDRIKREINIQSWELWMYNGASASGYTFIVDSDPRLHLTGLPVQPQTTLRFATRIRKSVIPPARGTYFGRSDAKKSAPH